MVFFIIVGAVIVIMTIYMIAIGPEKRMQLRDQAAERKAAKTSEAISRRRPATVRQPISQVGTPSTGGGLACPKCGGTQFKARRSKGARAGIGVVSVASLGLGAASLAVKKKNRVQCVTCGNIYQRG